MKNRIALIFTALAVSSCNANQESAKPQEVYRQDCSMTFSSFYNNAQPENNGEAANAICQVLPVKIDETTKCEISGSNKIDNLVNYYNKTSDDKILFMAPLSTIKDLTKGLTDNIPVKDKVDAYFFIQKLKDRAHTNLFDSLKDYKFKGMSCIGQDYKFVSWISDKDVIIVYEMNKKATTNKDNQDD